MRLGRGGEDLATFVCVDRNGGEKDWKRPKKNEKSIIYGIKLGVPYTSQKLVSAKKTLLEGLGIKKEDEAGAMVACMIE